MHSATISNGRDHVQASSLSDLARMTSRELVQLYRGAKCPASIAEIAGLPRGRMLAVRGLDSAAPMAILRRIAGSAAFPWGGKTFDSRAVSANGAAGAGINRLHVAGRHSVFPFHLRKAPSVVDGNPCVFLDYDLPDNPWVIRKIHDEVREVERGLLLGPALFKTKTRAVLVLWFALDQADQARPIGA